MNTYTHKCFVRQTDRQADLPVCTYIQHCVLKCFMGIALYSVGRHYHSVGRRYVVMAQMPTSLNTFSKPPNSSSKPFYVAGYTLGPLL